ncbi:MAG: hypothetical protein M1820_009133 [Bogoriella megaspora]|nr:MAG: hypothetical protein M1820_009133 [Bogoriella megaspora]
MRTVTPIYLILSSTLIQALPFIAEQKREEPAYSVVPVDGGSSAEIPSTVVKTLPPKTRTVISTSIATTSESESTILLTSTITASPSIQTVETTITTDISEPQATASATTVSATETTISASTATNTYTTSETAYSTITESPAPTPTSYYDDGMWHTLYPIKSFTEETLWNSTVVINRRAGTGYASYAAPTVGVRSAQAPETSSVPVLQKYENGKWETMYSKPMNGSTVTPVRRNVLTNDGVVNSTAPYFQGSAPAKPYTVVNYDSPAYDVTKTRK